ncbi:hypothetical protein LEP1GSC008_1283 [Leptospira kirschneri serovar Bulgarica str. Nikolaevo]|uniref:Uncharacterized protein n=1 Tax=Leptospira kirschneri serovar Bulgarica str. Nikolaevo TaxID=1240687 RepID=M6FHX7_9LEPT|nr:hypothetical protein LEP1GSC008_1283 [Leptospira kirschneri serovar Bulgarica str. Nikolaevo]
MKRIFLRFYFHRIHKFLIRVGLLSGFLFVKVLKLEKKQKFYF